MQIQVTASDANNIICQVTPTPVQTVTIDRGVAGNGIVSIVPVTIGTLEYLRITYTNGTVSDVGPITSTAYTATSPINIVGNTISLLTVPISLGGTGQTTANAGLNALLPSQTGNASKYLQTDGTNASWDAISLSTADITGILPTANGGTGQTTANAAFNALVPAQTGNSGKYLTTDGTNTSWATNPLGTVTSVSGAGTVSGLTLTGTVTTSGSLTLGGTLDLSAYNGAGAFTTLSASGAVTLSGGTANGVAYLNGSKVLTTGSALTFDGTNLGLGGSANNYGANIIYQSIYGSTAAGLDFYNGATRNGYVSTTSTDVNFGALTNIPVRFIQNGSEQMRLTSTGLGIGTSSPVTKLDLSLAAVTPSNTSFHGLIVGPDSGTTSVGQGVGIAFRLRNTAGGGVGGNGAGAAVYGIQAGTGTNTGALAFYTRSDASTFSEQMRLDSSGNLGLGMTPALGYGRGFFLSMVSGTANPSLVHQAVNTNDERLYLTNNMAFATSGFSNSYTYIKTGAAATYYLQQGGAHLWYNAPVGTAGNAITFTQAMTLTAGGNLLVGRTTNLPDTTRAVFQSSSITTLAAYLQTAGTGGGVAAFYSDVGGTQTVRCVVRSSGNLENVNNSYGALSDIKLKENIVDASPKLDKLNQVRIVNYSLKNDPNQKLLGVVAQELEQVFPGMIDESPDRDKDGNDLGTTTKSVKYSVFVPMLIKAIQELKAEFDAYKATHP